MNPNASLTFLNTEFPLSLISFTGVAQLSNSYDFSLECVADLAFNSDQLLGKLLSFACYGEEWSGWVKSCHTLGQNDQGEHFFIKLVPELALLDKDKKKRVFRNQSLGELVDSISKANTSKLSQRHLFQDHWIQFDESDYEFINRLLAAHQIIYYFDEKANWILSDNPTQNPKNPLSKNALKNLVFRHTISSKELFFVSDQIFRPGDCFSFENNYFVVHRVNYQISENKLMTESLDTHSLSCEVRASTKIFEEEYKPISLKGYQSAYLSSDATAFEPGVHFKWDEENSISYAMPISQFWCGVGQGLHFIPEQESLLYMNFIEGDPNRGFVAGCIGSHNENPQPDLCLIQTKEHRIQWNNSEDSQDFLLNAKNSMKEIGGGLNESIQENENTEIQHEAQFELKKGKSLISANEIVLKVGASELIIKASGVQLKSSQIELQTPGGVNQSLARLGDFHQCPQINPNTIPHVGGAITEGSDTVLINGLKAARLRDEAFCNGPSDVILEGVPDLLINGQACSYHTAMTLHGGTLQNGSHNVYSTSLAGSTTKLLKNTSKKLLENWLRIREFV